MLFKKKPELDEHGGEKFHTTYSNGVTVVDADKLIRHPKTQKMLKKLASIRMGKLKKTKLDPERLEMILNEIKAGFESTLHKKPFNSPHEGWAIILEEVEELWDEVKLKPKDRSVENMRAEALQVASSALRFYYDLL